MIERLQQQLSRPVLEFLQQNEAMHALLSLFAPQHAAPAEDDTSIAWEDGELADQTEHTAH
jgi:hypothetical protein